jgi:hypothetical protein
MDARGDTAVSDSNMTMYSSKITSPSSEEYRSDESVPFNVLVLEDRFGGVHSSYESKWSGVPSFVSYWSLR